MPFIRVWIHYVWAVKDREPILTNPFRDQLFDHIRQNAKEKNIFLDNVNGYHDHIHCLISLAADQTIEKVAQLISPLLGVVTKQGFIDVGGKHQHHIGGIIYLV